MGSGGEATGFPSSSRGTKKKYTHTHTYIYIYRYLSLASSSSYPPYSSDFSSFVAFSETHTQGPSTVSGEVYGDWPIPAGGCTGLGLLYTAHIYTEVDVETTDLKPRARQPFFPIRFFLFQGFSLSFFFNFRVFDINVQKKRDLPSLDMPSARHFWSRQYWHRLRLTRSTTQFFWRGHW